MGQDTEKIKIAANTVITTKLEMICDSINDLKKEVKSTQTKNDALHSKLFEEIANIKIAAASDHPNCKTGVKNSNDIDALASSMRDKFSIRDKWGIALAGILVGSGILVRIFG